MVILLVLLFCSIFAGVIAPYDYAAQDLASRFQGPSLSHFFGTDNLGRDIFSRVIYGARISLIVGLSSVCLAAFLGIILGALSGYYGNVCDNIIMRAMRISLKDTPLTFDYQVTLHRGGNHTVVRIANFHTNIVYAAKNDQILINRPVTGAAETELTDRSILNLRDILEFAQTVDIADIAPMIERQETYNSAIAAEGLNGSWGAEVGRGLLERGSKEVELRARAAAAAGSDARMNGCEMPVVIVSGSGNQGIAASVPVVEFAQNMGVRHGKPYRLGK